MIGELTKSVSDAKESFETIAEIGDKAMNKNFIFAEGFKQLMDLLERDQNPTKLEISMIISETFDKLTELNKK